MTQPQGTTRQIDAVAFDLMDTLVHDPYREALTAAFGDRMRAAFAGRDKTTWPRFETGELTEDEFWASHAEWSPDLDAFEKVRVEQTVWLDGMQELVAEVRAAGCRVVIATNYPSWIDDVEERMLDGLVDEVVASCRVGVRKPDPRFYAAVAEAAHAPPQRTLFVDDREENIAAAHEAGMIGIVFGGALAVRGELAALGVLPD